MSGHSKWAGIKHKKAIVDAKRANAFTKIANDITIAARAGGGDPMMNPALRLMVDKARRANMPKDNVERAIKRGTGELGGAVAEELLYEGFAPGNVGILVAVLTDSRNRAGAEIRQIFLKNGGRFAEGGGVAYLFSQRGVIRLEVKGNTEAFEEACIESGAEDYKLEDGFAIVYTSTTDLHAVSGAIERAGFPVESASIEYVPNTPIEVGDEDLEKAAHLVELLEEYDDVTHVFTNLGE